MNIMPKASTFMSEDQFDFRKGPNLNSFGIILQTPVHKKACKSLFALELAKKDNASNIALKAF